MTFFEAVEEADRLNQKTFEFVVKDGTTRHFISVGQPGWNAKKNNRNGFPTKKAALTVWLKYAVNGKLSLPNA